MIASALRRFPHVIGVALIAGLACGLYWPFLGNPRVFDDWTFFSGIRFSYFATHPFGLDLRLPPYFSLAVTEVLVGSTEAHRLVSLAFHIACALALYKLIYDLLRTVSASGRPVPGAQSSASAWAFLGAAAFAIHPVAVYGAGYLVQRTIVFATLFSLLSIVLFVRGLARGRHADAMSAALMYSIAVLSKEHSVLLPVAAALAVSLVKVDFRFSVRHAAIYLSACAPAAIFVTLLQRSLIGEVYEPDFAVVATQIEGVFGHAIADFPWAMSAVARRGCFSNIFRCGSGPISGGCRSICAWTFSRPGRRAGLSSRFRLLLRLGRSVSCSCVAAADSGSPGSACSTPGFCF
ncbi:MAG TPA: hypothetical protein VF969_00010 [Burkholderiales bacterium]